MWGPFCEVFAPNAEKDSEKIDVLNENLIEKDNNKIKR